MTIDDLLKQQDSEQGMAAVEEMAKLFAEIRREFVAAGFSKEIAEQFVLEMFKVNLAKGIQ